MKTSQETDYKAGVTRIIQNTYNQHGRGNQPWGWDDREERCSYAAGCAIGPALEYPEVMEALFNFDSEEDVPTWVKLVLDEVQTTHDTAARKGGGDDDQTELRRQYREDLEQLASDYNLELKSTV